jgi:hypothetical protein
MFVPAGPPPGIPPLEPTSASPSRRRKGVLLAAVVTVLAVGGAATFAATQLAGGTTGGAESALEVGEKVLASIENEDVLGMLDVLLPGESELFRQPAIDYVKELSRLEVLSPAADLAAIEGIDLSVTGGSVQVRNTNVADITNIELTGEITATVDGEALPIGDLLLDLADDADTDLAELDETTSEELELPLTAVEVDGRWYLSVFYSVAEAARTSSSSPPDIPESGIVPSGGATPEDALDVLLDGIEKLDVSAVIASLNPGEASALQRYAPLFIDEAQSLYDEAPFEFEVTQAEYTVSRDGSRRRHASIDLLAIEGSADGSAFEVEYSDGCFNVSAEGEEFNSCELDDQLSGEELEQFDDMLSEGPVRDLIDLLEKTFADYEQPGITLVQTDGSWYVSPIGTYFDQFLALARALDRAEIDALIEAVPLAAESFFEEFFGTDFVFEDLDDPFVDDPYIDDPYLDDPYLDDPYLDDPYLDDPFLDDPFADETIPVEPFPDDTLFYDPLAVCYDFSDAIEASTCFQDVVQSGEASSFEAPVEMLHPECGVAEARWSQFEMTDVAFFELIDTARPCFLALVESGELNETDLPTEYTKPECYEGRNWYQVLDDPDYDQRVSECASS